MMKIASNGYWTDEEGKLFIPVGVNYWPATTGVEMWEKWDEKEVLQDLDLVAALGLNTVRFFLRWQDFESQAGSYSEAAFQRLTVILEACRQRKLHAQPSLFVGWMSGGTFFPEWKGDKNLFSDPEMIQRGAAFAAKAAACLKPFAEDLAGIDLGNELCALPDSSNCSPKHVREWCRQMTAAIHSEIPGIVILSGCDHQQVVRDTGWRFGEQPGIDVYTMHGYPVPGWHPVLSGGLRDSLTQSLLPYYVKCAKAFAPVLLQEFGTILTRHPAHTDAYLKAILPACWQAGANGFLWWCLKDIPAEIHPYVKNNFESELGLVDKKGKVKDGLRFFVEFAKKLVAQAKPPEPSSYDIHLYFPQHYYHRDNPRNPGNNPEELSSKMIMAHHLLSRLGHQVGIVRGGAPIPHDVKKIVINGAFTDSKEIQVLHQWVENEGGILIWNAPDPFNWAAAASDLIGAEISDYLAAIPLVAEVDDRPYHFHTYPRKIRLEANPLGAEVLSYDDKGNPFVLIHRLGKGRVVTTLADVDAEVIRNWAAEFTEDDLDWYEKILSCSVVK